MWPYEEDDFMELGESGWIPVKNGGYKNKYTGHTLDESGREYDENGVLIFEPDED